MGNKIMSNRAFVDEKYTRPQGVHDPKDGDFRKLRHLILNGQLAPCFPGTEECTSELDECPICFLFYPSLNRSRCCSKAICTECYLQIKLARFARSSQCPFCKTSNYMVEFRGAKTVEEKGFEQAEEQKVIEAKIRIRQKELHDEAQRVRRQGEDAEAESFEHETNCMSMEPGVSSQAVQVQESVHELNKNDGFDVDIEDMMLMEAIWLSIQEQDQRHQEFALAQGVPTISALSEEGFLDNNQISTEIAGRTVGFARAIAALGERQATSAENRRGKAREFTLDLRSDQSSAVEAGTSFSSNIPSASELPWEAPEFHSSGSSDNFGETSSLTASASMLPVSFDDQIMLAVALSLADAQAQASRQ